MVTLVTEGVKVSVINLYRPEYSSPERSHYVYTYQVSIHNGSPYTVKLLSRKWIIHDIASPVRIVEGEGVLGQQPTLEPGKTHQYVSGCSLKSEFGKMHGHYSMERIVDGSIILVSIPEFGMTFPSRKN